MGKKAGRRRLSPASLDSAGRAPGGEYVRKVVLGSRFLLTIVYRLRKLNQEFASGEPMMEISFASRKMQKSCSSEKAMRAAYGVNTAKKLKLRLAELEAAASLEDLRRLPQASCHEYKGSGQGHLSEDLADPYRLIFEPANDPVPSKEVHGLD